MLRYPEVVARTLAPEERAISTREVETPLVLQPVGRRDLQFLKELLDARSHEVISDAAKHGAVLIRGFDVASDRDFEDVVLSIRGMVGMDRVFMAEEGRVLVDGARFVHHTNSIYTTGGSVELGAFHSENYFVPDVPRFIFFFCRQPSWLGGETGLVNTAGLYEDLPEPLKRKLESRAFLAAVYPIEDVARRYRMSSDGVRRFCAAAGLSVQEHGGKSFVLLHKPSVLVHPLTRERALAIHYWSGLMRLGFRPAIRDAFLRDYAAARWTVHGLLWQYPALTRLLPSGALVRAPRVALRDFRDQLAERIRAKALGVAEDDAPVGERVHSIFEPGDERIVADAVRHRFSSFRWKSGDVLMVDNAKMAHAGMPGFGPRLLRAMICNPMALPCSGDGPGLWRLPNDGLEVTIGARIEDLADEENREHLHPPG